jgi:Acetyltransferase (GNAT) domain
MQLEASMPELQARTASLAPPLDITSMERSARSVDGPTWDAFILACGGSFLGTWCVVRANRLLSRIRVFEFFVNENGSAHKIGQCAVTVAPRRRIRFLDRLHLLPAWADHWERCVGLVVERCGAGVYEYGSVWNAEERRPPDGAVGGWVSRTLPGRRFLIDRVDFARWPTIAQYRDEVSENIRRDYRKAVAASATLECRQGLAALRDVITLCRLRSLVMRRNRKAYSLVMDIARHVLKIACIGKLAFIATVRAEGRCPAAFFGVRFGEDIYYLAGGTEKNANGYGSYLFLALIEDWFATHPTGKLYLGRQVACVDPATYKRGHHLYRRKLRAIAGPGTAFHVRVARVEAVSPATDPAPVGAP